MTPDQGVADLEAEIREVPAAAAAAVAATALFALGWIKRHASGPAGFNLVTGAYVRSWTAQNATTSQMRPTWIVGTNAPQALRLENGFYGLTDRLGRLFFQPAFPHWAPSHGPAEEFFVRRAIETLGRR